MSLAALFLALAILTVPGSAWSQVVVGSVFDSSGAPVAEAEALLLGTTESARTDARGQFALPLRRGTVHLLRVRRLGYLPRTVELPPTAAGDTTFRAIELPVLPGVLPEVMVKAQEVSYIERISGFAERLASGTASRSAFWTRSDIARRNPSRVSDLLLRSDPRCGGRASVFLNGALLHAASSTDIVHPLELEAMEVYRGASQLPARFNATSAPGRRPGCVVLLWTR